MFNENLTPKMNPILLNMEVYPSKAIALQAKKDPSIVNLSFGEPAFGPPDYLLENITSEELTIPNFLDAVKRYESSRGSLELRKAISVWYQKRYGLVVNPETEIMITHGGVEAITLAILSISEVGDSISITDPSYMLYKRTILALGRKPDTLSRPMEHYEYKNIFDNAGVEFDLGKSKAIIINSPENPSGYVLDKSEWELIGDYAKKTGLWIIHDEVYDTMAFERKHIPCKLQPKLSDSSILINSFSKKFGIPGLRIGWMIANEKMINLASKVHDYLYLGVNIQYEKIATRLLSDERSDRWLSNVANEIQQRAVIAMEALGEKEGFRWPRKPLGAMFLFPNVCGLYESMPDFYKIAGIPIGDAVARYLIEEKKVAVVPGSVYGPTSSEHVRLVLCTTEKEFDLAIQRLKA